MRVQMGFAPVQEWVCMSHVANYEYNMCVCIIHSIHVIFYIKSLPTPFLFPLPLYRGKGEVTVPLRPPLLTLLSIPPQPIIFPTFSLYLSDPPKHTPEPKSNHIKHSRRYKIKRSSSLVHLIVAVVRILTIVKF